MKNQPEQEPDPDNEERIYRNYIESLSEQSLSIELQALLQEILKEQNFNKRLKKCKLFLEYIIRASLKLQITLLNELENLAANFPQKIQREIENLLKSLKPKT